MRRPQAWILLLSIALAPSAGYSFELNQTRASISPETRWSGEKPVFIYDVFFSDGPWGNALELPPISRPDLWNRSIWRHGKQWLAIEIDQAPTGKVICVAWTAPDGRAFKDHCQQVPQGPARLSFDSPDARSWPAGTYTAEIYLAPSDAPNSRSKIGDVLYAAGGMEYAAMGRDPAADDGDGDGCCAGGVFQVPRFPWPPPAPTTRTMLKRELVAPNTSTFGDVAGRLTKALTRAKYHEESFFSVPGGFALVTRLEQIDFDGTPKPEPGRWSAELSSPHNFSLGNYIRALFTAPEGNFRVVVFVISDEPFSASAPAIPEKQALAWLNSGLNSLPKQIADLPYTEQHACTVLIYQFKKTGVEGEPIANPDGATSADLQLERSGILGALTQ